MTKYFPHRILINEDQNPLAARQWCRKKFGPIPVKKLWLKIRRDYSASNIIYDEENARWCNRTNSNKRWNRHAFYFKKAEDAMLFKLIWGGEIENL